VKRPRSILVLDRKRDNVLILGGHRFPPDPYRCGTRLAGSLTLSLFDAEIYATEGL
jgi:hypothetical protein